MRLLILTVCAEHSGAGGRRAILQIQGLTGYISESELTRRVWQAPNPGPEELSGPVHGNLGSGVPHTRTHEKLVTQLQFGDLSHEIAAT